MARFDFTPPPPITDEWVEALLEQAQAGAALDRTEQAAAYAFELGWARCHSEMKAAPPVKAAPPPILLGIPVLFDESLLLNEVRLIGPDGRAKAVRMASSVFATVMEGDHFVVKCSATLDVIRERNAR